MKKYLGRARVSKNDEFYTRLEDIEDELKHYDLKNTGEENKGIRHKGTPHGRPIINGTEKYLRIIIKRK